MPPTLDVYVISERRDAATVARFLDLYVDRAASEDRGSEELMMLPLGSSGEAGTLQGWEWRPAETLTRVVEYGLEEPCRAFAVYLTPRDRSYERAILAFTTDGRFVAGLSLGDPDGSPPTLARARQALDGLQCELGAQAGFVGAELPPPIDGVIPAMHPRVIEVRRGHRAG